MFIIIFFGNIRVQILARRIFPRAAPIHSIGYIIDLTRSKLGTGHTKIVRLFQSLNLSTRLAINFSNFWKKINFIPTRKNKTIKMRERERFDIVCVELVEEIRTTINEHVGSQ